MRDAELLLRRARRPLVIGIGGGGDVVGALATAELARVYDQADPIVGGLSWERRPIDPQPGPRAVEEIEGAEELAPGIMLAGAQTQVRDSGVRFAESRMAEFLDQRTVLVDVQHGARTIADGLERVTADLGVDLTVFVDVGGDVLAQGDEAGLRSPLCDAVMLAAAGMLAARGRPVLAGVFGIGCDAELTPGQVLALLSRVAADGGVVGVRGLTEPVAQRLEQAIELIPTEASAQAVRAFRGDAGFIPIRGGARAVELTIVASLTFYLDPETAIRSVGRLARAVADAPDLEAANDALHALGVRSELDFEREAAH